MRQSRAFILLFLVSEILFSCSKNASTQTTVAAVNIVNANVGSQGIMPNFWGSGFSYQNNGLAIGFGTATNFSIVAGSTPLTIAQAIDTSQPFFSGNFTFKLGGIYSLFVAGNTTTPDTLFVQDGIPHYPLADSLAGLRIVNLVQGETINIDIQGNSGLVTPSLPYKGVTGFQSFSANTAEQATGYIFEFRDAESDSLLTTYQVTITPNLCQTLIFCGSSASGYSAFAEDNF